MIKQEQFKKVIKIFENNGFVGLRQYLNTDNNSMHLEGLYQPKWCKYVLVLTLNITNGKWSHHHVDVAGHNYMRIKNKDSMMICSKMGNELREVL